MRRRRYPSDTTDREWLLIEPLLPVPACQTPHGGRPEAHPRREIVDALRYLVDSGCKWSAVPSDFPPFKTVFGFFTRWSAAGVFNLIRDQLRRRVRRAMGTSPRPVAVVIDSQSVKVAATVPRSTSGYDAGKKTPGRKRHIVVDLKGLPVFVMVTPADMHDSVAAREVLFRLRLMHPAITIVWAALAYAGTLVEWARSFLHLTIKTVSRPKGAKGFVLLPRSWVVERSLAWLLHARRNVRDYETLPEHSEAMLTLAAIALMTRRLTRPAPQPNAAMPRPQPALKAA
ncbi:IS5 family transposase [Streptomyces sp. NBC_01571]|uniref:IS5 family transposase n=1 Tax=Streptomyces sp. NBC_01571 TaxID=2975883 RepID=UPI002B1CDD01|nr:IS5 family transposase [Streptomyces sp. NBC_01571]